MKNILASWGLAMSACIPLLSAAQATKPDAPKPAPPLSYQSAFADYKPYKEVALADWRALNDALAGAAGGARGQAGQATQGMGAKPAADAPVQAAPPEPTHAGRSMNQETHGGQP